MPATDIILPHIDVRWTASETGDTFSQYNVYRRRAGQGDADWLRIATVPYIASSVYRDYAVASRQVYEYTVTALINVSGDLLESEKPDPVAQSVLFDWTYIHDVRDPGGNYALFFSLDGRTAVQQDVQLHKAWGRAADTAFVGELDAHRLSLTGLPDVYRGFTWEALRSLASRQVTDAGIFCVRPGVSGDRYFANITSLERRNGVRGYEPALEFSETHFDESV